MTDQPDPFKLDDDEELIRDLTIQLRNAINLLEFAWKLISAPDPAETLGVEWVSAAIDFGIDYHNFLDVQER